MTLLKKNRI